ncbi:hypothetical protein C8B47_21860 [filamentous cyanobacterium CCP4]|nr:hypothetical protein C8B47_21860 [filamentous cyanobacterium CCP4]
MQHQDHFELESAIRRYRDYLNSIQQLAGESHVQAHDILRLLTSRDQLQSVIANLAYLPPSKLHEISELDASLKILERYLSSYCEIDTWRVSYSPSSDAWWWFLSSPKHPLDKFDWLFSALTIALLTTSLALLGDIVPRFLTERPNFLGSLGVTAPTLITLLAAGGALTEVGRLSIEKTLSRFGVQEYLWHEVKLTLAIILTIVLIIFRSSLPSISYIFNDRALEKYAARDLSTAQTNYELALNLNPENVESRYGLGRIYEDLNQWELAQTQYLLAAQLGFDPAFNELGRLYIRNEQYEEAISLLIRGLDLVPEEDIVTKYVLLKNLGWARFGQERYAEAKLTLEEAIELEVDVETHLSEGQNVPVEFAAPHCLLAQSIEGILVTKEKTVDFTYQELENFPEFAMKEWESCYEAAELSNPDEDMWFDMARQRLNKKL